MADLASIHQMPVNKLPVLSSDALGQVALEHCSPPQFSASPLGTTALCQQALTYHEVNKPCLDPTERILQSIGGVLATAQENKTKNAAGITINIIITNANYFREYLSYKYKRLIQPIEISDSAAVCPPPLS